MPTDHHSQLDLLHQLGQLLLALQPRNQRLAQVLEQMHTVVAYDAVRLIVLNDLERWSLSLPAHTAGTSGSRRSATAWPQALTAELLQRRSILRRALNHQHYLGIPICWQGTLYGALEMLAPITEPLDDAIVITQALTPFLAIALRQPATELRNGTPHELAPSEQQQLAALTTQFQTPTLLQPLLAHLLQAALNHSGAAHGAIHLAETNSHGLHLLAFEASDHAAGSRSTALVQSSRSHDLAKIALANGRAMIRQTAHATQFAAPIVHDNQLLGAITLDAPAFQPQALLFVQRLAEAAGPAVLRAQFYQELADARTHLQQVFYELPTGLALTERDGTLLRANPAWWNLWGIQPAAAQEIKIVPWDMLPHMLERLPDPLAFTDLFTRAISLSSTALIVLQNPWQELQLLFMPVRDTLGLHTGFLLAANDVTREREADRLKSEFVSVVSHELRTPLTSILGYTELLLAREFEPAERKEFIQTVHKEADHLSSLVEDLLNVSRLDAGKIKLERWVIALPKLVRELVAQLNTELDIERHRLLLDVPESLPPIYADRDRVRQILSNLLSNAIKYSPEGGEVVLHAAVMVRPPESPHKPTLPPDPALLITVRDQGIGIPEHELPRIFDRFYRVDNSNTRRIGGTGLGLAITRALVELHGGRIWADSVIGEGSTFYVTLPLATEMMRTRP